MNCLFIIIQKQMALSRSDPDIQLKMRAFKEHLKLSCKIIVDDIYDNYWSYENKYSKQVEDKKKLQAFVSKKYEKSEELTKVHKVEVIDPF